MTRESGATSQSLLRRVRLFEADAWSRLSTLYSPVVYGWCRRAGLQDNDAADVVQDVFRQVFQGIGKYRGIESGPDGGSFRGWLWSIARNEVRVHFRRKGKVPQAIGGTDAQLRMSSHADGGPSLDEPEPDADQSRRRVLHRALDLVRGDFSEQTWEIFSRVTLHGHSAPEVAVAFGLTDTAVRQAKFRVLRRLREELDGLL